MPEDLNHNFDLVLRNARVIDPSQNIDGVLDVGVSSGKIAAIGKSLGAGPASDVRDLSGKYLSPGLIDLHGHWYGGSTFGIDPAICLKTGVTTAVDAGTTGFLNFDEFRRDRLEASEVQLLAYLNISAIGIPAAVVGELFDIRYARPKETAALIEKHREVLLGVKVRIGERMSGANGKQALALSLEAAEATGVPMMVHFAKGADTPEYPAPASAGRRHYALLPRLRRHDSGGRFHHPRGSGGSAQRCSVRRGTRLRQLQF